MKTCNKCNKEKELTYFYTHPKEKDGYRSTCKECTLGHTPYKKPENEKKCTKCGIIKQLEMYYERTSKEGYKSLDGSCKSCRNKGRTLRRKKTPGKEALRKRELALKSKYNISLEVYKQMLENQDYKCKICKQPKGENSRGFAVDHCHKTGKVRGLLCFKCNSGLGSYEDNIEYLISAIKYLSDNQ